MPEYLLLKQKSSYKVMKSLVSSKVRLIFICKEDHKSDGISRKKVSLAVPTCLPSLSAGFLSCVLPMGCKSGTLSEGEPMEYGYRDPVCQLAREH